MTEETLISYKTQVEYNNGERTIFIQKDPISAEDLFDEIYTSCNPTSLYENITDGVRQKPRFDIDINDEDIIPKSDDYIREVVREILICLKNHEIHHVFIDDIYIYASHCPDLKKKSYHIIIDKIYHRNNREAKKFYEYVLNGLLKKGIDRVENPYLDSAVYKKGQLFRLPYSEKLGSGRKKMLIEYFDLGGGIFINHSNNETYEDRLRNFKRSLLTYCYDCELIKIDVKEYEKAENLSWDNPKVQASLLIVEDIFGDSIEVRDICGNFIIFNNDGGLSCPLCLRTHENENPYLFFYDYDDHYDKNCGHCLGQKIWTVMFSCRRDSKDSIRNIGYVSEWGDRITTDPLLLHKNKNKIRAESIEKRLNILKINHRITTTIRNIHKKINLAVDRSKLLMEKDYSVSVKPSNTRQTYTASNFVLENGSYYFTVDNLVVKRLMLQKGDDKDDTEVFKSISLDWLTNIILGK